MPGASAPGGVKQGGRESHGSREPGTQRNTLWDLCVPPGTASVHHSVLPWDKCVGNSEVTPRAKGREPPRKLRNKLEPYEGQCEGRWTGLSENTLSVDCWSPQAPSLSHARETGDPRV